VARRVYSIEGVTTAIVQPVGLSNRMPSLKVWWDRKRFGVSGEAVVRTLFDSDPRVGVFPARNESDPSRTGVTVNPYMMAEGEAKIVADRLYSLLSSPTLEPADPPAPPAADLTGQWDVRVEYAAGGSSHTLHLRQRGNDIDGAHRGDFVSRDLTGTIDGDSVRLRSAYTEQNGDALNYTFSGKVTGDEISGALDMGEYLSGRWTARRRRA
jgi:L-seryl-tRNA(Ser) seleniumtransferase